MEVIGIALSFVTIMFLIYKKIDIGISLFVGAIIVGLFSTLGIKQISISIFEGIIDPISLQLMTVVALISGLGYVLKETGDLDGMIDSLIAIFKNTKLLTMVLPALIGTLSVPGGAILSAPMVEESGNKIELSNTSKTAINLFFRHIGYYIYPLYSPIILASELLNIEKVVIIKYNFLIMAAGVVSAYFIFFKDVESEPHTQTKNDNLLKSCKRFLLSFLPILSILVLAILFKIPFYIAVIAGLALAVIKNPPQNEVVKEYKRRIKGFFTKGVKYNLMLVIAGVMGFKSVVEASGAVDIIAETLIGLGVPLVVMIILLGFVSAYVTGVHVAAMGLLIAIFSPMIPVHAVGPYVSLLFTSIFLGYLLSPIHLCMVLTKQYFKVKLAPVYRLLIPASGLMMIVAILQVLLLE